MCGEPLQYTLQHTAAHSNTLQRRSRSCNDACANMARAYIRCRSNAGDEPLHRQAERTYINRLVARGGAPRIGHRRFHHRESICCTFERELLIPGENCNSQKRKDTNEKKKTHSTKSYYMETRPDPPHEETHKERGIVASRDN